MNYFPNGRIYFSENLMDYEIGIFRNHFHDIFQEALAEILKKKYIYIYIFKKLV